MTQCQDKLTDGPIAVFRFPWSFCRMSIDKAWVVHTYANKTFHGCFPCEQTFRFEATWYHNDSIARHL